MRKRSWWWWGIGAVLVALLATAPLGAQVAGVDVIVFPSAAHTATTNSADQFNQFGKGGILLLNVTAVSGTTPTLDCKVQLRDHASATYIDLPNAAFAQKTTASGMDSLIIYPGATVAANRSVSSVLGTFWRAACAIAGTTPSFTFTLGVTYLP
jgi:hypothetical protein